MNNTNINVEGLKKNRQEVNEETYRKVHKAINDLKKSGKKITVSLVAKKAGVSVATIYNNKPLKNYLDQIKVISNNKNLEKKETTKNTKIQELRGIIDNLKEELKKEKEKNALLLGHLERKTTETLKLKEIIASYRNISDLSKKGK